MKEYFDNNHIFLPLSIDRNNGLKEPIRLNILTIDGREKKKKLRINIIMFI